MVDLEKEMTNVRGFEEVRNKQQRAFTKGKKEQVDRFEGADIKGETNEGEGEEIGRRPFEIEAK